MNSAENLKWIFTEEEIGRDAISKIEKYFDVVLPKDYVDCALVNHGGSPTRRIFKFEGHEDDVLNALLSLNPQKTMYLINVYHNVQDRLAGKVIPFADTAFGDLICFDYRKGSQNPTVVFWDHEAAFLDKEKGVFYICDTFSEFLEILRPLEK